MFNKLLRFIINSFWNLIYPEWTDEQVQLFYAQFNNPFELNQYLVANGFKWGNDLLNFNYYTDTYERPNQTLARKFANCLGYLRLYSDLLRQQKCVDYFEEIVFFHKDHYRWHGVLVIYDRGLCYLQTNMNISQVDSKQQVIDFYKEKGYITHEVKYTWSKI